MKTPKPIDVMKSYRDVLNSMIGLPSHIREAIIFHDERLSMTELHRQKKRTQLAINAIGEENQHNKMENNNAAQF